MRLYHGSKNGIDGPVRPASRDRCDFGRGFYMGTEQSQPLTLVCNYPHPILYTIEFSIDGLDVLELGAGCDWAMLVAYCRGKMEAASDTALYRRMREMERSHDVIVGAIANDRMFVVLDRFFNGDITDVAVVKSLSALQLGRQYVAKTQRACDRAKIVEARELSEQELETLKERSASERKQGIALAEQICREHRREGRYFDELLEEEA